MTETFCDSGAVKLKAGVYVNSDITPAQYEQLITQAEAHIMAAVRENLVGGFAGYSSGVANILEDTASSYAAVGAINYDMSGYTSRAEALTMANINWATVERNLGLLKERDKATAFVMGE